MPIMGMSRMGSREVAGIGMASVAHHTAINSARPAADQAVSDMPPGGSVTTHTKNKNRPRISPIQAVRADAGASVVDAILSVSPKLQPAFYRVYEFNLSSGLLVSTREQKPQTFPSQPKQGLLRQVNAPKLQLYRIRRVWIFPTTKPAHQNSGPPHHAAPKTPLRSWINDYLMPCRHGRDQGLCLQRHGNHYKLPLRYPARHSNAHTQNWLQG